MITRRTGGYALFGAWAATLALGAFATRAQAAETLNICHNGHPIMESSIKIIDKWAKQAGVNIASTPISYTIYLAKVTQILTTNSPHCDMVSHNDDRGQIWKQYLPTTHDVSGIAESTKPTTHAFGNDGQKPTSTRRVG